MSSRCQLIIRCWKHRPKNKRWVVVNTLYSYSLTDFVVAYKVQLLCESGTRVPLSSCYGTDHTTGCAYRQWGEGDWKMDTKTYTAFAYIIESRLQRLPGINCWISRIQGKDSFPSHHGMLVVSEIITVVNLGKFSYSISLGGLYSSVYPERPFSVFLHLN